jgi:hypothetical protein
MKNLLIIFFLCLLVYFNKSAYSSESKKFGAGFILGEPSGLTGKYFFDKSSAVDLGIGSDLGDGFYLYGDYLYHYYNIFPVRELKDLSLYFGAGLGFHRFSDDHYYNRHDRYYDHYTENRLDIRVPVGVEYTVTKIPLGIFVELVPALRIIPDIDFNFWGGIGVRYYF